MAKLENWSHAYTFTLAAIVVAIGVVAYQVRPDNRVWIWLVVIVLLILFAVISGKGVTGYWRAVLIDDSNRISLSRLQMLAWTVMVLSGFLTAALSNVHAGDVDNPLDVAIPTQVWVLMGIATTTLVGSPLIKSTKKDKPAHPAEVQAMKAGLEAQGRESARVQPQGHLATRTSPESASWSDVFTGEEVGNVVHLDLSRVQMFYFNVIAVLAYAAALGTVLANTVGAITEFPGLSNGMLALLGVSHAGYLAGKAVPNTATPKDAPPPPTT